VAGGSRLVGAFAAGRVINPRLVRSQYYGGMIWGVSFALHEHAVMDLRSGRPMNPNLGEYHVPVNADVPSLEAILIDEHDPHVESRPLRHVNSYTPRAATRCSAGQSAKRSSTCPRGRTCREATCWRRWVRHAAATDRRTFAGSSFDADGWPVKARDAPCGRCDERDAWRQTATERSEHDTQTHSSDRPRLGTR
jgi:hypothetical protein